MRLCCCFYDKKIDIKYTFPIFHALKLSYICLYLYKDFQIVKEIFGVLAFLCC